MLRRQPLLACTVCGCHVIPGTTTCPHCSSALVACRRGLLPPTRVALVMGLGAATTIGTMSTGCGDSDTDNYANAGQGASDGAYESAVSTYGHAPSAGSGPSSGYGTTGPATGPSGTTTGNLCNAFGEDTPCGVCLAQNCCPEGEACQGDCITAMICLDACDASDVACAADCQSASPRGFELYQALYQCGLDAECDVSCLPP